MASSCPPLWAFQTDCTLLGEMTFDILAPLHAVHHFSTHDLHGDQYARQPSCGKLSFPHVSCRSGWPQSPIMQYSHDLHAKPPCEWNPIPACTLHHQPTGSLPPPPTPHHWCLFSLWCYQYQDQQDETGCWEFLPPDAMVESSVAVHSALWSLVAGLHKTTQLNMICVQDTEHKRVQALLMSPAFHPMVCMQHTLPGGLGADQ